MSGTVREDTKVCEVVRTRTVWRACVWNSTVWGARTPAGSRLASRAGVQPPARTAKWIAYQITYLIGKVLSALNTRPIAYPSRTELDSLSVSLSDRTTCAPPETGEHGEPLSHTHDRARRAHDTREHGGELNLRTAVGAG